MSLPLGPTLAEARREVAIELNWGSQVSESNASHPLIDRMIRKAYHRIIHEFPWALLRQTVDTALIHAQSRYEVPDGIRVGKIERVLVVDDDGHLFEVERGLTSYEREAWSTHGDEPNVGLPLRYDVRDQYLEILPAPRVTDEDGSSPVYVTLRVDGYFTPQPPQSNSDRIPVNGEAVVGLAVAMLKAHIQAPDAQRASTDAEIYLARLRPTEGVGESFRIGGAMSRRFPYSTRRSTPDARQTGQGGWWEGWTPRL